MKKIFLLFIALLFISGFKAEEQPQNADKKEQQAAEISNFVFLKIRDSFILQGFTSKEIDIEISADLFYLIDNSI